MTLEELCKEYNIGNELIPQHRFDLFRSLVSYLYLFIEHMSTSYSGMLDKEVTSITVQSIAQLTVDCTENPGMDPITFSIEPCEREF